MKYLSVFTLLLPVLILMSPASCADKIHEARIIQIEIALEEIRLEHVPDDSPYLFNYYVDEEKRSVLVVETNSIDAVIAIEDLIEFTPAWEQNIRVVLITD